MFLQALFAGEHLLHQADVLQRRHRHLCKLLGDGQVVFVEVAVELVGEPDQAEVVTAMVDQRRRQAAFERQLAQAVGRQMRRRPGLVAGGQGDSI
ncbi:hypothetical protein D3C84_1142010 [compost metagenome]